MIQHLLRFEKNGPATCRVLPADAPLTPAPATGDTVRWLAIEGGDELLPGIFKARGLPRLLVRRIHRAPSFPLVLAGENHIMLRIPSRHDWKQTDAVFLTLLLLQDEVITIGPRESYLNTARDNLAGEEAPSTRTAGELLLYLLDSLLDANIIHFMGLRAATRKLSDRLSLSSHVPVKTLERGVVVLRRQTNRLINQFQDFQFALSSLLALMPHPLLPAGSRSRLQVLCDAQSHLAGNMDNLVARHNDLQQQCHFLLQQQTDSRISKLTALSAIFMPLSLITGIFGMNFSQMIGLDWTYGFPATLLFMLLLSWVLWLFMRRQGWW